MWNFYKLVLIFLAAKSFSLTSAKECQSRLGNTKLFCYYGGKLSEILEKIDDCRCSHLIFPENSDKNSIEIIKNANTNTNSSAKILINVKEFNEDVINLLSSTKIDGIEIDLKKLSSREDISDVISTIRTKIGSDLFLAVSVPSRIDVLAKYFDFKSLSKHVDVFTLQTHFLGVSKNTTFHPSRLSGIWDVQNTDSMVDLVSGLGAPLQKLVITTPVQGFKFTLQNATHTAPGSPATHLSTISRKSLCEEMEDEEWVLERDQDQAGPYIFRDKTWIAFEDGTSVDIKAKYARVRGLAGLGLKDSAQDDECDSLIQSAFDGLSKQSRAPRGAVLHSLEREILDAPSRAFDNIQVSPYRITRVIDTEGKIHVIRQDTRTEFQCSRQGYFVHPRSCGRFYRCVKFDQLSDEFSVFEFDCPAGLAFDEKVEVCVWPGSLPHGTACQGSSEIAPVPRERFVCPEKTGYYADPENCRWFFACMDHGKSPLSAYEFRCPYGLVFDEDRLICEWPWLVPKCGSGAATGYNLNGYVSSAYGSGGNTGVGLAEGRSNNDLNYDFDLYDGLGSLNVKLGGVSGVVPLVPARTYSSLNNANTLEGYQSVLLGNNAPKFDTYEEKSINVGEYHEVVPNLEYQNVEYQNLASNLDYQQNNGIGVKYTNVNLVPENVEVLQHGVNIGAAYQGVSSTESPISTTTGYTGGFISSTPGYGNGDGGYLNGYHYPKSEQDVKIEKNYLPAYQSTVAVNPVVPAQSYQSYEYQQSQYHQPARQYQYKSSYVQPLQPIGGLKAAAIEPVVQKVQVYTPQPLVPAAMTTYTYNKSPALTYQNILLPKAPITPKLNVERMRSYYGYDGYHYDKPSVAFVEEPKLTYQQVVNTVEKHVGNDAYGTNNAYHVNYQNQYQNGYHYEKPKIEFNEEPKSYVNLQYQNNGNYYQSGTNQYQYASNQQYQGTSHQYHSQTHQQSYPKFEGYHYEKPKVVFEEKPTYQQLLTQVYQRPAPVTPAPSTSYQTQGYHYEKPRIPFNYEEKVVVTERPVNYVTPVSYVKPLESQPSYQEVKIGYNYEKPAIKFEEKPVIAQPVTYQEVKVQHQIVPEKKFEGYHYEKPAIAFEEKPKVPLVSQPVTYQEVNIQHHEVPAQKFEGYHYEKPKVVFEEKPRIPIAVTPQPATYQEVKVQHQQQNFEGYHYEKPKIVFEEKPQVAAPVTYQEVKVQHQKFEGYHYEKPKVVFEEKPVVPLVSQPVTYQEVKVQHHEAPAQKFEGYHYEKPKVVFEEKPQVAAPVTYQEVKVQHQQQNFQGYHYEKPKVVFEEKPAIVSQPVTYQQVNVQPKVVPQVNVPLVSQPVTYQEVKVQHETPIQKFEGYHYEKPKIVFEEKPKLNVVPLAPQPVTYQEVKIPQPVTYQEVKIQHKEVPVQKFEGYHYEKPKVVFEEKPVVVPQPVTYQEVKVHHNEGYRYEKPAVVYEERRPVIQVSSTVAPVTYQEVKIDQGYRYDKPTIKFEEVRKVVPALPSSTPAPAYVPVNTYQEINHQTNYEKVYQKVIEEKPVYNVVPVLPKAPKVDIEIKSEPVLPSVAPVRTVTVESYQKQEQPTAGYVYEKPEIVFEEQPKPKVKKVEVPKTETKIIQTVSNVPSASYYYEKPVESYQGYLYPKPQVKFEEEPPKIVYESPKKSVEVVVPQVPVVEEVIVPKKAYITYDSYSTTQRPTIKTITEQFLIDVPEKAYLPVKIKTTARPTTTPRPRVTSTTVSTTPSREYLPVRRRPKKPSTTTTSTTENYPTGEYLPVKTPTREYLPVTTSKAPSREYLPVVSSTQKPSREYLPVENSSRKPKKIVKVLKSKTIVKNNDFHPMLSAKLGAQCTCVSNTVTLRRRKPSRDPEAVEEESEEQVYQVRRRKPQKSVKRVEENSDENYPEEYKINQKINRRKPEKDDVSDDDIVKAVRVGQKLVKNSVSEGVKKGIKESSDDVKKTIKDGVKEGIKESEESIKKTIEKSVEKVLNAKDFDRYGPGGVRSRSETLQGTVDCQRAGLFRHPKNCNKFYECRWDEYKKKFTLHVFNCPIHLTFDGNLGACNWPSQGPACVDNTLLPVD